MEESIKVILNQTILKSLRYNTRIQELVAILNIVYDPLTSDSNSKISVDNVEYGFDELLMLIFELVQLISIFETFKEAETSLRTFLTLHSDRLVCLCLAGKLSHLSEIIEFKKEVC